jgi:hypothetical protein
MKKNKIKIFLGLALSVVLLITSSCQKNNLNPNPKNNEVAAAEVLKTTKFSGGTKSVGMGFALVKTGGLCFLSKITFNAGSYGTPLIPIQLAGVTLDNITGVTIDQTLQKLIFTTANVGANPLTRNRIYYTNFPIGATCPLTLINVYPTIITASDMISDIEHGKSDDTYYALLNKKKLITLTINSMPGGAITTTILPNTISANVLSMFTGLAIDRGTNILYALNTKPVGFNYGSVNKITGIGTPIQTMNSLGTSNIDAGLHCENNILYCNDASNSSYRSATIGLAGAVVTTTTKQATLDFTFDY